MDSSNHWFRVPRDVGDAAEQKDIFAERTRRAWNIEKPEARCDLEPHANLGYRSGLFFLALWHRSRCGRTLSEIKQDAAMVEHFAKSLAPFIAAVLGRHLDKADWAIVTPPKRRHLERNFASLVASGIAALLGIPFLEDLASCHSKQRVHAVFSLNFIPEQRNIIVFDDFVSTGQTFVSMQSALSHLNKNLVFVAGINNKA